MAKLPAKFVIGDTVVCLVGLVGVIFMISTITIYWTEKPETFNLTTYVDDLKVDRYRSDNRPFQFSKNGLDANGMKCVVVQTLNSARAAITIDFRVGSVYEDPGKNGIALIALQSLLVMGDTGGNWLELKAKYAIEVENDGVTVKNFYDHS